MRVCEYDNCGVLVFGTDKKTGKGYCKRHQYLRTDTDKRSMAVKAQEKANKARKQVGRIHVPENEEVAVMGGGMSLQRWFEDRRKEMTGKCHHCNGKSCRDSDQYFKFSICHLLPKAYFPSIATHEYNWVELCFWNNNCHGNMDNKILDLTEMNCFDEIVTKFQIIYPSIAPKERRRIPNVLLQYLQTDI